MHHSEANAPLGTKGCKSFAFKAHPWKPQRASELFVLPLPLRSGLGFTLVTGLSR